MNDKLVHDYIFAVKPSKMNLKEKYRDILYNLAKDIIEAFLVEKSVVNTNFYVDPENDLRCPANFYALMIVAENMHFCCHYLGSSRIAFVDFWMADMRLADQALLKMKVMQHLGERQKIYPHKDPTAQCINLILPDTSEIAARTNYQVLSADLEWNLLALCGWFEDAILVMLEDMDAATPDYIVMAEQGYLVRHVAEGEIRLSVFTASGFDPKQILNLLPEYAWYEMIE